MNPRNTILAIVVLAFLAVSAPASAAEFHAESAPATLSGTQTATAVLESEEGELTCETASLSGTQSSTTTPVIEMTPTYENCHDVLFGTTIAATVTMNGCVYKLHSNGTVDIVCPAGKTIEVDHPGCTVTYPAQNGRGTLTFTNELGGTNRSWIVDFKLEGLENEAHWKGLFPTCLSNTTVKFDGSLKGSFTVRGKNGSGTGIGIWVE